MRAGGAMRTWGVSNTVKQNSNQFFAGFLVSVPIWSLYGVSFLAVHLVDKLKPHYPDPGIDFFELGYSFVEYLSRIESTVVLNCFRNVFPGRGFKEKVTPAPDIIREPKVRGAREFSFEKLLPLAVPLKRDNYNN